MTQGSDRWKQHEAMIRRVVATADPTPMGVSDSDIEALTYCLESVSDNERAVWGAHIDRMVPLVQAALEFETASTLAASSPKALREARRKLRDAAQLYMDYEHAAPQKP